MRQLLLSVCILSAWPSSRFIDNNIWTHTPSKCCINTYCIKSVLQSLIIHAVAQALFIQASLMVPLKSFFCENGTCWQKWAAGGNNFYQHQRIRIASGEATHEAKSSEEWKGTAASFKACRMGAIKTIQDPATEFWQRTLLLNTFIMVCTLS